MAPSKKSSPAPGGRPPVAQVKGRLKRKEGIRADEVLETALELFSQESYADVTVQDIARRLGITHSLIYYYYESKEKLFQAAVLQVLDRVMAEYDRIAAAHDDPVDLLEAWFDTNVKLADPLRSVVRIMFEYSESGGRRHSPSVERVVKHFYGFERRTLADSIRRGVERGRFRCDDPERMAVFVSCCIDGIYYGYIVRKDVDLRAEMAALRTTLWRLLEYSPPAR